MKVSEMKKLNAWWVRICLGSLLFGLGVSWSHAHDFKAGTVVIDHPYATPSLPGATTGAVYFRVMKNTGKQADQLLGARTPVAEQVSIHRMQLDGDIMRMREINGLELSAKSEQRMRHGQSDGVHLMLEGLKAPLRNGDRFDLTLQFAKAGERTVKVWVQTPRNAAAHQH